MEHLRLPVAGHLVARMSRTLGSAGLVADGLEVLGIRRRNAHVLAPGRRGEALLLRAAREAAYIVARSLRVILPHVLAGRTACSGARGSTRSGTGVGLPLYALLVGNAVVGYGVLGDMGDRSLVRDARTLFVLLV